MNRNCIAALLASLSSALAPAQTPPPAEAFFRLAPVIEAQLSPSGRRLAISSPVAGVGRVGVFTLDLETPGASLVRAALFRDADVPDFDWVDDERLIFSVANYKVGSGEDDDVGPGLFVVRFDGGQSRTLIRRQFGDDRWALHPNHRLLRVPVQDDLSRGERGAARRGEVVVGELKGSGRFVTAVEPGWLDVRDGSTRPMDLHDPPRHAVQWWFSPQGEPRLVLAQHEGRQTYHWLFADESGRHRWKPIAEGTRLQMPWAPVWVGADRLLVQVGQGAGGEAVVVPFDLAAGRAGTVPLLKVQGFDFEGHGLSGPDGRLRGVRVHGGEETTVWFDDSLKALQAMVDAQLPGTVNRVSCRRCAAVDAVLLVRSYSDRQPEQLWLHTRADGRWRRLGSPPAELPPERMAGTGLERIEARDGRPLPVWVTGHAFTPDGKPQARPAIVLVHGGPWVRNGYWRWEPLRQFLASRGYVVIEPEFRGSAGYGTAHLEAGYRQWGQAMQDDVADALRWAQKAGWASDKACIAGASYGGYSTLMGLIRHPELYRCGAAWLAVTDPFLFIEGSWWVRDDIPAVARLDLKTLVGDPEADADMLKANSPLEQAARIRAPLLLAFGDEDQRVPLAHGRRLRAALEKAGRPPAEWIVYPGEGHGWRKLEHQVDFAQRLERFFAQHLQ